MSAAASNNGHSSDHTHNGVNGNSNGYHDSHEVSQHSNHYGGGLSSYQHTSPMLQSSGHHSLHNSDASGHNSQQQSHFTTLNSAGALLNGNGTNQHPSMSMSSSTAITPTSVSSFFNSFGSGTGNSPPPLTPNGLLSGLHSFLFADSSTLGLDSFADCVAQSDVGCLLPPPVSSLNSYHLQQQSGAMVPPSSTSPVSLASLNSASPVGNSSNSANGNTIRLPPFCTI